MSITLKQTCGACPEQYDAYKDGEMVGYLRLRHGRFSVECPDSGGKLVYSAHPKGDGLFDYDERDEYLKAAVRAINHWIKTRDVPPNPDEEYTVEDGEW